MALTPEIDRLLECDEKNIRETRRFLSEVSPNIPEALNQAAVLYVTANRAFGQGLNDHFRELADQIAAFGLNTISELESHLRAAPATGQQSAYAAAQDVLHRFRERECRGVLLARIGVLYAVAAADLLRMRVTGPLGNVRIQCESLALMSLMRANPQLASEWRGIMTEADGRAFYGKYQPLVKQELRKFQLEFAYDNASSTALHSRFAGISLGLEIKTQFINGKIIEDVKVSAQEINPENPDTFLLILLHILRTQDRILQQLPVVCGEIDDRLLIEQRIPAFTRSIDGLYSDLARSRPDIARRYAQATGAAAGP